MRVAFRLFAIGLVATLPVLGAGCLSPTNPFDPDAPESLQQKARVTGKIVDAAGPVAATVKLTDVGIVHEVVAGEDGTYAINDVTPGVRTLTIEHQTHLTQARDLVLLPGEARAVDVVLVELGEDAEDAGRIRGIARKTTSLDDETPDHSGITVELVGLDERVSTGPDGAFSLVVTPGTYQLRFSAPDHLEQTVSDVVVELDGVAELPTLTLEVNPGGITGTVTLEPLTPGGETHGGVTVTVGATGSVVTGDDDTYQIIDQIPGPTVLRFTRSEYETLEKPIVIESGRLNTIEPVRMLRATGSVTGAVDLLGVADDGGVTITLEGASGTFSAVSAGNGSFSVTGVPTGTYDVLASKSGFVPADGGTVEVLAGQTVAMPNTLFLASLIGDFAINGGSAFTNDPSVELTITANGATQMRIAEDADFSGVAAVPFDPSPTFLLSNGDGDKTIFLELVDADGVATGPFSASIVLDTTPPEGLSFTINGGAPFSNNVEGVVVLAIAAIDPTSGVDEMQLSTDGTFDTESFVDFSTALAFPLVPNLDGPRALAIRFRDRAGNETDAADALAASITLDRTVPVIASVAINNGAQFASSPFVTVDVVLDPGSTDVEQLALSSDPQFPVAVFGPFSASSTFLLAPGEDEQTVSVKVKDAAGNESTVFTDTIIVDATPPSAPTILVAGGADVTNDSTPALSLSAQGAVEVRVALDAAAFDPNGSDFVTTFPTNAPGLGADGLKTVFAQFRDDAGNLSAVVSDSVELDTAAPVLGAAPVVTNAGDAFTRSVSVTAAFDVTGATEMAIAVDGDVNTESFQPFTSSIAVLLPAGDCVALDCKSVCAVFRDGAGNTSAERCDAITLDTTVPSAPLIVEQDSVVPSGTFTLNLVEVEPDEFFDHYEILIDPTQPDFLPVTPGAPVGGFEPIALALDEPAAGTPASAAFAPNILRVRAVDEAGNVSPESAVTIVVDNVAPDAPVLAGLPSPINADTVSVNFVGSNPADDDATFSHYLVDTSLLPEPFATTLLDGIVVTLLPDQTNTITVQAVDEAGNVSAGTVEQVREDSASPFAPSIAPFEGSVRGGPVELGLVAPSKDPISGNLVDVTRYQVKDGVGEGFRPVTGDGPFLASIRPGRTNEVCVRGVDDANNVSIEDCALIEEVSRVQITSNADGARAFDVFGDMLFFQQDGGLRLRDLRTGLEVEVVPSGGLTSVQGRVFASGNARQAIAVWGSGGNRVTIARVDLTAESIDLPGTITVGQFAGTDPFVSQNDVVYLNASRVRRRGVDVPLIFDPSQAGTDISGADVTLCSSTTPRTANGVTVWCEGSGTLKRKIGFVANAGGPVTLSSAVALARAGSLGSVEGPQQPQVADATIAWAENVNGVPRVHVLKPSNAAVGSHRVSRLVSDDMRDLSRDVLAAVQVRDGLTNDIAILNLENDEETLITDDVSPQGEPVIDGTRLFYGDTSVGEVIQMHDVSNLRWLQAGPELAFEPVTSTEVTAFIGGDGERIALLARVLPLEDQRPVVVVDAPAEPVAFFGPAKADPTFAVGGRRVAYLVGTASPFKLKVAELDATTGLVTASFDVAADADGPIAIGPDGDELVYVSSAPGNPVNRVALPTPLTGPFTPTNVTLAGNTAVKPIMVDVDSGMIVAQRGGEPDARSGSASDGQLVCAQGGATGIINSFGGAAESRGPKVARLIDNTFLFAAVANGDDAQACFLTCSSTPTCNAFDVSSSAGVDSFVQVGRDGRISYLSNAVDSLEQVVIFDLFARRWSFVLVDDFQKSGLSVADRRVVWSDPSLGGPGIFELTFP